LAECGANVVVHASRPHPRLEEVACEARNCGVRAVGVAADLGDDAGPAELLRQAEAELGPIDILVLNASVQVKRPWLEIPMDEFDWQMRVNLRSSLELMQRTAPGMSERGWGRILTIGSVNQVRHHPDMVPYCASKSALVNMVRNLAKQLGPDGITINNLAPGIINTDRNVEALADPEYAEKCRNLVPVRDFGQPEDCVGAALLLCSDAGRYITGADFFVDGGMQLP
jgi:NAD(P)-dependent dehydrogenase (short-subunit alcohol dehydrogenase family)